MQSGSGTLLGRHCRRRGTRAVTPGSRKFRFKPLFPTTVRKLSHYPSLLIACPPFAFRAIKSRSSSCQPAFVNSTQPKRLIIPPTTFHTSTCCSVISTTKFRSDMEYQPRKSDLNCRRICSTSWIRIVRDEFDVAIISIPECSSGVCVLCSQWISRSVVTSVQPLGRSSSSTRGSSSCLSFSGNLRMVTNPSVAHSLANRLEFRHSSSW